MHQRQFYSIVQAQKPQSYKKIFTTQMEKKKAALFHLKF